MAVSYWLFKSEPDVYSLDHLKAEGSCDWDGIRNYQARNILRDDVKKGDKVLFYHSRVNPPTVVGVAEVTKVGYPDPTQFDPKEKYFDPKSNPEDPRWYAVEVKYKRHLKNPVSLHDIKKNPALKDMVLVNRSRLSIQPVTKDEWDEILTMSK